MGAFPVARRFQPVRVGNPALAKRTAIASAKVAARSFPARRDCFFELRSKCVSTRTHGLETRYIRDMTRISHSVAETEAVAAELARSLKGGECIALHGEMGAGKTHF